MHACRCASIVRLDRVLHDAELLEVVISNLPAEAEAQQLRALEIEVRREEPPVVSLPPVPYSPFPLSPQSPSVRLPPFHSRPRPSRTPSDSASRWRGCRG